MRPDGSGVRLLTRDRPKGSVEADDYEPAWSPDGRWIAFTSTRDHRGDGVESQDVYLVAADGSDLRRLTSNERAEYAPAWTADGRIAFWRCRQSTLDCALVAVGRDDGEEEELYRPGGLSPFGVEFDAAGTSVLFAGSIPARTAPPALYVARLGRTRARRLIGDEGEASRSRDGARIVFTSERDRNGRCLFHDCTGWKTELYLAEADGSDVRRLTETDLQELFPDWSPNGAQIVYARIRSANDDYDLFTIDPEGGETRQLTDNDAFDWMPDWYAPPRQRRSDAGP